MNRICCIFNFAPHYRASIFHLMDEKLSCDFYFSQQGINTIRPMEYNKLKGFIKELKYVPIFHKFYWQTGSISLALKNYNDFIITGEPYCISTWIILFITKIFRKKIYLWSHGWYGDESYLKKIIKKIFFSLSHKVLLYGDHARNLMIKEGLSADKLICIYNSLDYDKQIKIRERLSTSKIYQKYFNNNLPTLLYIGRIQKSKKIGLLIEALNALNEEGIICNLVIIGKETKELNLYKIITKFKLNNYIWFYGECYEEDKIGELIYNADLCVSPGEIGLTAMHSLVYGTPVITHNNYANQGPEFEAIEQGVTGNFFEEDSVKDLCDKIKIWVLMSSEKREIVRSRCYKIIDEKYNPHKQIIILLDAIR